MKETALFQNEPLTDWFMPESHSRMRGELARVEKALGRHYPLLINGKKIFTGKTITSVNPANPNEVVGLSAKATRDSADQAAKTARKALRDWRKTSCQKRSEYLFRVAHIMRQKRFELAAWLIFETGKNWQEADADTAEAIDFLEYYGRQMIQMEESGPAGIRIFGEINESYYSPRGVALALGIWNFGLAINTGMSSAAMVTGNTVIFKPSSLSPVIGYKMAEIFLEAGIPPEVLTYLPGDGKEIGRYLVQHPGTDLIVFTGSADTGLEIDELAAAAARQRGRFKRRILETGGKNAIIVDSDADLDQAVEGVIISWLGYQGQKCSACSRVVILEDIHDHFIKRLMEAAGSLKIGDPREPGTFLGPLIDESAVKKVQRYIEIGKREGRLAFQAELLTGGKGGCYQGPAIFTEVSPSARIAQEEIFGPVLAVIRVKTFSQALEAANATDYALTGGVYSRSPKNIKMAGQKFDVGNLYINRPITGAVVGRQPFGGHRGSGTGPKAGGPDYLKAFMTEKTITVNIMRRGFAPLEINESQR